MEDHPRLTTTFPRIVRPDWNQECWFLTAGSVDSAVVSEPPAVLVVAFSGPKIVLADIRGRGLTVPSGHVEPGETAEQAAVRETYEETGGVISADSLRLIGYHTYTPLGGDLKGRLFHCPVYLADIHRFERIPPESESAGIVLADPGDLEKCYCMWDDLVNDLFEYAVAERAARTDYGSFRQPKKQTS